MPAARRLAVSRSRPAAASSSSTFGFEYWWVFDQIPPSRMYELR